jgi:hypothetical protein
LRALLRDPGSAALQNTDDDIAPERAVVFEVSRDIDGFLRAAELIGLEYLSEEDSDSQGDDELQAGGRLYMVMPSLQSLREIIRLWGLWQRGTPLAACRTIPHETCSLEGISDGLRISCASS